MSRNTIYIIGSVISGWLAALLIQPDSLIGGIGCGVIGALIVAVIRLENGMRKLLPLALLLGLYFAAYVRGVQLNAHAEPEVIWLVKVTYHNSYNTNGMEFFELRRGGENAAEAPVISVPGQSDLASFLRRQDGKRVMVSFRGE